MSIYHCSISNVSRAKGSSSCATLSYISGEAIWEERTGQKYSYGRRERVLFSNTVLPENAPDEFKNASVLFNSIENYEKAENSRTAKKIIVALPREFDFETQKRVLEQYIKTNFADNSYCSAYAIHIDKGNNNPHAHILIANRQIDKSGNWAIKRKMEYEIDDEGNRIPLIDKKTGLQKVDKRNRKQWKRINKEINLLDKKEFLLSIRENWATTCNIYLSEEKEIDHRNYKEQGIQKVPTIHEGYASREIEKRGEISYRKSLNDKIRRFNEVVKHYYQLIKEKTNLLKIKADKDTINFKIEKDLTEKFKDININYSKFNERQIEEIEKGVLNGLPQEKIRIYAKPEFDDNQMFQIRCGLESGISHHDIKLYAKPEFDSNQMFQIRCGLESGISPFDITLYAKPEYNWKEMQTFRLYFSDGYDYEAVKTFTKDIRESKIQSQETKKENYYDFGL